MNSEIVCGIFLKVTETGGPTVPSAKLRTLGIHFFRSKYAFSIQTDCPDTRSVNLSKTMLEWAAKVEDIWGQSLSSMIIGKEDQSELIGSQVLEHDCVFGDVMGWSSLGSLDAEVPHEDSVLYFTVSSTWS